MGAADIVPGVSGGTIAFLLGIYEELIYSIKVATGDAVKHALKGNIPEAFRSIPWSFLLPLGIGLLSAVLILSKLLSHFLDVYPSLVWAFFFGLVIASIFVVRKRIKTWNTTTYILAAVSALLAYGLVGSIPVETPNTYLLFFLSGAIAICAMILPGISGSFLLVLMGKYEQLLQAVLTRDVLRLGLFMIGAVVGIAVFSRVVTWLFNKHHDAVVATLTGFMIGALRKIWPWKEVLTTRVNSHGEIVPVTEMNILPSVNDSVLYFAVSLMIIGFLLIYTLDRLHVTDDHKTEDIS